MALAAGSAVLMTVGPASADPVPSGPSWTIQASPDEPGASASVLSAVSCRPDGTCMAVGTFFKGPHGDQFALAERRDGSTWSIEPTPTAAVDYTLLSGVSCPGPASCVAVGYTVSSRTDPVVRGLAEVWAGGAWTVEPVPLPPGATWVELSDVSCPALHDCVAVGGYIKNQVSGEEQPLAEQWDGSSWSVLAAPNPHAENGSSLSAVDCPAPGSCEAVGDYDYADVGQSLMAYSYDGTAWTAQKPVNPVGQEFNAGNSVSCAGPGACTAVGIWTGTFARPLAEYWDASAWSRQTVAPIAKAVTAELTGVSCAELTACTAVGDAANDQNDNPTYPVAESWAGTSWQLAVTPEPAGTSAALTGVSCVTASTCVAVGTAYGPSLGATLVEVSSG